LGRFLVPDLPRSPYPAHRPVTAFEAREADRAAFTAYALPSLLLMEHAGRGLAALAASLRTGSGPVAVLCGPGSNGGDGFACARFLASWGVGTRVLRCAPGPARGDAAVEERLARASTEIVDVFGAPGDDAIRAALDGASLVVDALFGIGLDRPLAPPYPGWIGLVNAADCPRLAADVPSGLSADDGRLLPVAVEADVTAAMGLPKRGCFVGDGPRHAGRVVEVDIGLPADVHRRFQSDV
jgi:NAD(P)H-hydrate epimerase